MKNLKYFSLAMAVLTFSCVSWVFAKGPFNEMPKGSYAVDLTHASIVWKVSHFGLSNYVGRFAEFDATIEFNPNNIEKSTVSASINPLSIQTAYPNADEKDFDQILATDTAWFNGGEFASIEFESNKIEMLSDTNAKMTGILTFLGITKEVVLDVTFNGAMKLQPINRKPTMGFSATTTIQRSDFGMTRYLPNVGDTVEVAIEGEFIKSND